MPIVSELYPQPRPTGELVAQFRGLAGRIIREADSVAGGIVSARNAGAGLGGQAAAIGGQVNQIASGVRDADPGFEASQAGAAAANSPGVSAAIGNAEGSSGDPRAPVPGVDTGSGTGWIGGNAGDIRGRGGAVIGAAGQAEEIERRAFEGRGI